MCVVIMTAVETTDHLGTALPNPLHPGT